MSVLCLGPCQHMKSRASRHRPPAEVGSDLQGLPGSSGATQALVRYQEAVLHKDWHLAWSVAPTIQAQHAPPSWTWVQLKLKSPPAMPLVCAGADMDCVACGLGQTEHALPGRTWEQLMPHPWLPCFLC